MPGFKSIKIRNNNFIGPVSIPLPSSKSESNRALIIRAFAGGTLHNLSDARDTQTMMRLLKSEEKELNVLDAGTTMRFLLGYCAVTNKQKILTGTPRMCERPIGILVEALRQIGAEIVYLKNNGYPPLETQGFTIQHTDEISMQGDISSQYISSVMMAAPALPKGLTIHLKGKVASKPYILMTLELMKKFGAKVEYADKNRIMIQPSGYKAATYSVESDWSGASYWFAFAALAKKAEIFLKGLKSDSLQGDHKIMEITDVLGVKSEFTEHGLKLTKKSASNTLTYDFSDCPDLAQTVAVICAAKGIKGVFTGLQSLKIKETDRIFALQKELAKIGASLVETDRKLWTLTPSTTALVNHGNLLIETYDDHRMAMAFAPLACLTDIEILNPAVVEKSYPGFWDHMEKSGFVTARIK